MKLNKSFCGCFTDRGGFFKKSPWPPEAIKVISWQTKNKKFTHFLITGRRI
jgi:hypothetical protein